MNQEIEDLKREVERWKRVAVRLADCHAATAEYDGSLKSCSSSRRNRFKSICDSAANYLQGMEVPRKTEIEDVIARCREAAK